MEARDAKGNSPLLLALRLPYRPYKHSMLDILFRYGARVDACDNTGRSPLHVACVLGDPKLVEFFLMHGASILAADSRGRLPTDLATNVRMFILLWNSCLPIWQRNHDIERLITSLAHPSEVSVFVAKQMSRRVVAGLLNKFIQACPRCKRPYLSCESLKAAQFRYAATLPVIALMYVAIGCWFTQRENSRCMYSSCFPFSFIQPESAVCTAVS